MVLVAVLQLAVAVDLAARQDVMDITLSVADMEVMAEHMAVAAVKVVVPAKTALVQAAQSVLFGPVTLVASHQQIQETCNA